VSHITLFEPKSYGNLGDVWALADQRGGDLFMIRRREFIAGLGGAAAWPRTVRAQQGERVRRIGIIEALDENDPLAKSGLSAAKSDLPAFTQSLADLGWVVGRNVRMDIRYAGADISRIRALARELVGLQPDIIVAVTTAATAALQRETRTIPIVFMGVGDPVASGLVAALKQPGGNITGFGFSETPMGSKWLELLSEIAPGLKRAAIMFNPDTPPASLYVPAFETAAWSLKVGPIIAPVHSDVEIESAINALGGEPRGGLVVNSDSFMFAHRVAIISMAARNNVPAVYSLSQYVRDGGLLSYGGKDSMPSAAPYVDRILRGAKPNELPVQFSTKFELVINLKTAKALGLTILPNLLALADEVIE
jgi:putative tryptophan/tyrosine transport system substrate-binding protein